MSGDEKMEYVILIHRAEEGGYWGEFPGLPGCYTQAATIDKLLKRAPDAIESHLDALQYFGHPIPDQQLIVGVVTVPPTKAA